MQLEFNEKSHRYTLDGKPLTGVTTVLGVIAKPALIGWSARMVCEYIRKNCKDGDNYTCTEQELEEAQNAHTRKRDDAASKGTDVHAECEKYINFKMRDMLYATESPQVQKFMDWAFENKVKFLASEKAVYHADDWYAGTMDFLCEIDGKKYVGDIKTTSGIYDRTPFAQCAAYRHALEHCEPELAKDIHGSIIVRLGKKGDFEVKESYDYETDLMIFRSALNLYRGLQTFKK